MTKLLLKLESVEVRTTVLVLLTLLDDAMNELIFGGDLGDFSFVGIKLGADFSSKPIKGFTWIGWIDDDDCDDENGVDDDNNDEFIVMLAT